MKNADKLYLLSIGITLILFIMDSRFDKFETRISKKQLLTD